MGPVCPISSELAMLFKLISDYKPTGDQPQAIEKLVGSIGAGNRYQTLLGVTGSGKTFTMANVIARCDRPVLIISPQQDARGAALLRVQGLLPGERRRVFRQLLRLLPARGLHPVERHLHREGLLDQRGDRAAADLGHELARQPPRRDRRRQRLVHLRPRLARGLHRAPDLDPARGASSGATRSSSAWWTTSTSATTTSSSRGASGCAATSST